MATWLVNAAVTIGDNGTGGRWNFELGGGG